MPRSLLGIALAACLLSACVSQGVRPVPDVSYVVPAEVDFTRLLAPPPQAGDAMRRDLQSVRSAERDRTAEEAAHAEASSTVDVFQFSKVLGPHFNAKQLPRTAAFFEAVYRSALPALQLAKDCWNRPRPFEADKSLSPLERSWASTRVRTAAATATPAPRIPRGADSPCSASAEPRQFSAAYPSGHATVGAMHAILLAQMVPGRRDALFEEGWEHGRGRLVSGVHFPSDIEAGRILGTLLVALMEQDAHYRADFAAVRSEMREVLGFAAVSEGPPR